MANFIDQAKFGTALMANNGTRKLLRNPQEFIKKNPEEAMQALGKGIKLLGEHPRGAASFLPEGPLKRIAQQAAKSKDIADVAKQLGDKLGDKKDMVDMAQQAADKLKQAVKKPKEGEPKEEGEKRPQVVQAAEDKPNLITNELATKGAEILKKLGIPISPELISQYGSIIGNLDEKKLLTVDILNNFKSLVTQDNITAIQPYLNNILRNKGEANNAIRNMMENRMDVIKEFIDEDNEATKLFEKVKVIAEKLRNKSPIELDENSIINNKDALINDLKRDPRYKSDNEYRKYVDNLQRYANDNLTEKSTSYIKENQEKFLRDPEKIYFDDYTALFKLCLSLFTYLAIFLIIFILLLSLIALCKLIVSIIVNIVSLFVNDDNMSRSLSLDYLNKTMTRCTKDKLDDDRFYIITEQKQNLSIFNIGIYAIYLIIFYFMLYFIIFIYSKIIDKDIVGNPTILFNPPLFITLLAFIIGYSIVHLFLYTTIFKQFVYSPYKELQRRETAIDDKIAEYILIYAVDGNGNEDKNQLIVDNNFFDIIYDASRLDELNDIFMNGVKTENASQCLEQKIMIYNLYCYLREYIPFSKQMQDKFKDYCTTTANNKPKFTSSDISMTFVSMLNNSEIKMLRKYNEDLNYYNQIPDNKIEYFNKLNTNITNKVKEINLLILTNTNTMIPFFLTIIYICLIVVLNFCILYMIIFIVSLNKAETVEHFNVYIYMMLYNIKIYIYDPIIKYIIGRY